MPFRRIAPLISLLAACGATPRPAADPAESPPPRAASAAAPAAPALDPPQPTLRLPRNFLPTGVRARLAIDPARDGFTGSIEITGEVRERSKGFWLHGRGLQVTGARLGRGDRIGERAMRVDIAAVGEDLLSLHPADPVDPGMVTIAIDYRGAFELAQGFGAYRHAFDGVAYIATQFESLGARRVFPCLDEPDSKVPWQLTLDVPRDLIAVANTAATAETALDATTKRITFAPSRPLPSYLIAFGVGPFELVDAGKTRAGTPIRVIALKGHTRDARWAAQTSAKIVQLLEDYFGMPYPYDKLDHLARPKLAGGAMENAGLITYGARLILRDPDHITPAERFRWIEVAAHEIAHQWFGDLVTTAWWDDIWLNEGFATWLGTKITAEFDPSWRGDLVVTDNREDALQADRLVTARRVRQPIRNAGDISQAFDSITYNKGASVLAMFERALGPEKFRDGVRTYIAKHRFGNATSTDFVAAISEATGKDVGPAFSSFLDQPGAPVVRSELHCEAGPPRLDLAQRRYVPPGAPPTPDGTPWRIPVCVAYDRGGARGETCTELTGATAQIALDTRTCPTWVFANAGGRGYYRIAQPEAAWLALRDHGWKQLTPVERLTAFGDVSAFAATGELDIGFEMSLLPRLLAERNRLATTAADRAARWASRQLSGEPQDRFHAWIRQVFGPTARKLGWQLRPGDDLDAEQSRSVVSLVAWSGDPSLRAAAVALARNWRTLPSANREAILGIAADADPPTFNRLLAAAPGEADPELRGDLLSALADVTNEARLRSALALALDPRVEFSEMRILLGAGSEPAQFRVVDAYFRAHITELVARVPDKEDVPWLSSIFLRSCDPARRNDALAFVREQFGKLPGGDTIIARGIEDFDQCVAARGLLAPRLAAWLAKGAR